MWENIEATIFDLCGSGKGQGAKERGAARLRPLFVFIEACFWFTFFLLALPVDIALTLGRRLPMSSSPGLVRRLL